MSDLLGAALGYAELGWAVLPLHFPLDDGGCSCIGPPCRGGACGIEACQKEKCDAARCRREGCAAECASPAKHPRTKHGLKDATTDEQTIRSWWSRWPSANVGLRTGERFDVLDVDGEPGAEALEEFCIAAGIDLPAGPWSRTGGGGEHRLYAATGIGNRAGLLTKVDWRGRNGYIVAPPSLHASGRRYEWVLPATSDLPWLPQPLMALIDPPKPIAKAVGEYRPLPGGSGDGTSYGLRALDAEIEELSRAPQGVRNHTLNACAFNLYQLVAGGELTEGVVEDRLRSAAGAIGLGEFEVNQTLGSARAGGMASPRNAPPSHLKLVTGSGAAQVAHPSQPAEPEGSLLLDPALVAWVAEELDVDLATAELVAAKVQERAGYERTIGLARRLVRDQQLAREADLSSIDVVTADVLLERERPPRVGVFGDLLLEGHNATIIARFKAGKSTVVENMAVAATTGGNFLGRWPVTAPMRVVLLNYELDVDDVEWRIRRLHLPDEARERLLIVNLRGHRLPLMTPTGRKWLVRRLVDHGADLLIVDPFGAAYASAGGESENDNAEVRRFTVALDEIKRESGTRTLVMPVHTGRAVVEDGEERGRGATVIDDWPDVQMFLTKDKEERRFLRTDGRAPFKLYESRLFYDEATGLLSIPSSSLGVSRAKAKVQERQVSIVDLVRESPGMNKGALTAAMHAAGVTNNDDKAEIVRQMLRDGVIHTHSARVGNAVLHYEGSDHSESEDCVGGWLSGE